MPRCAVQMENSGPHGFTAQLTVDHQPLAGGGIGYWIKSVDTIPSEHEAQATIRPDGEDKLLENSLQGGVPPMTPREIDARYQEDVSALLKIKNNYSSGQLTWTLTPETTCSQRDLSLVMFFIYQFFYFG